MNDHDKTTAQLIKELEEMRLRIADSETGRQRSKHTIRKMNARLSAMLKAFDGLIYVCSQDYKIEFMNERLIDRTGHDGTGELCYKVLHDRDSICPWCVNDSVFKGETVRWEVKSPRDNRWYFTVNTPLYNEAGTVSKLAMILDINELKLAEEALREARDELEIRVRERTFELSQANRALEAEISERKRAEAVLKKSEEKYNQFFRTSRDCVFITSRNGNWIDMNDAAVELFGYSSPEELMQVNVRNTYAKPKERAKHIRIIAKCGFSKEFPADLLRKDGTVLHTLITSVPRYDAEGNVLGFQGTIRDITERKRAEVEREKLIIELRDAMSNIKILSGMLPICSSCKKIRDDKGYWNQIEFYIKNHSEAEFSHGICPECAKKLYPKYYAKIFPEQPLDS